ncbi:MAG: phage regulatory CII family protein [Planctomycetota bacterium]
MESHEVLRQVVEPLGAKRIAHELRVSTSLVYKWCEEDTSGARNPLDRLEALYHATQDRSAIEWLCQRAGGYFVANPKRAEETEVELLTHTQQMLAKFSGLLKIISESVADDGHIDLAESKRIRKHWDKLKGYAESFVAGCEGGTFREEE